MSVHTVESCSKAKMAIRDTLDVVGGKWKLVLITVLRSGKKGFNELSREAGISPRILSKELQELEMNGLLLAVFVFKIPLLGSVWLIYLVAFVYLITILGIGLFISTQTDTQQQAMFIAWFFMVVFIMMSGLFTPVESMPIWGQRLNLLNPVAYFIKIMRMIMLKGSGFFDIKRDLAILCLYSVTMLSFAVNRYRKVS